MQKIYITRQHISRGWQEKSSFQNFGKTSKLMCVVVMDESERLRHNDVAVCAPQCCSLCALLQFVRRRVVGKSKIAISHHINGKVC